MKKGENYVKKGEKCIFLGYKLKKISRGGLPTPPAARRKLICGGKKMNLKRGGGGNYQNAQYIPLDIYECRRGKNQIFGAN